MLRGASPEQIVAILQQVFPPGSVVRVGDEHHGRHNVGVDLPRCPRGEAPTVYRRNVHRALEGAGVQLAHDTLCPPVRGQIRGTVQVGDPPVRQLRLDQSVGRSTPAPPPAAASEPDLPRVAIRDALGLVHLLWRRSSGHPGRQHALEQMGQALGAVLMQPDQPDCLRLAVVALDRFEAIR